MLQDDQSPYRVDPRTAVGASAGLARRTVFADAVRRARSMPDDTLALLRAIASHPRTLAVRRLTPSNTLDAAVVTGGLLPSLRQAIEANAVAAVLAVSSGQLSEARDRLLENHHAIELVLSGPTRAWAEVGLNVAQSALLPPTDPGRASRRSHGRCRTLA
ncbi:MAG: hypothetical protein U5K74_02090 [Gemmatimonadaceae bacterium]|nr:hypothetical protein [Gemmatimonadaceae bacterium]